MLIMAMGIVPPPTTIKITYRYMEQLHFTLLAINKLLLFFFSQ